jgi:hypothetical protein
MIQIAVMKVFVADSLMVLALCGENLSRSAQATRYWRMASLSADLMD